MIDITDLVKVDLDFRNFAGIMKYGRPLTVFNGRNSAQDAYEEAMDLTKYLKQVVLEKEYMLKSLSCLRHYIEQGNQARSLEILNDIKQKCFGEQNGQDRQENSRVGSCKRGSAETRGPKG